MHQQKNKIALISDTHGILRPEVVKELQGAFHIIHAGDVGDPEVLAALQSIAPLTVVRGNVDKGETFASLPHSAVYEHGGKLVYVIHQIDHLDLDPAAAGICCVVFGHSHQPELKWKDDVMYINPGSIGPRRFSLPVSMAWLALSAGKPAAEFIRFEI